MPTNERLDLNDIILDDAITQINPETIAASADIIQSWIDEAWAQYEITRDHFDTVWTAPNQQTTWFMPTVEKPIKLVFEDKPTKTVEEKPTEQEGFKLVINLYDE
jgi:hypothetical protein